MSEGPSREQFLREQVESVRKRRSRTPLLLVLAAVIVVAAVAAFEVLRPSPGAGGAEGPQTTTAAVPISITGFVQAQYPPATLEFNSTSGKSYMAPVTETGCANGGGGVCFVYYVSLPPNATYTVYAFLEAPGGASNVCDAGTVDVTTVGNYNVDVTC